MEITKEQYKQFKQEYEKALKEGKDQFLFGKEPILVDYAKYFIEYFENELKESVEEAAEKYQDFWYQGGSRPSASEAFIAGIKWQADNNVKVYTEEEVLSILQEFSHFIIDNI